ncbi:MAG: AbrB/MazE/SpoVT family DNA-binding domain-containing protein [Lachnospiraceae bacterium]
MKETGIIRKIDRMGRVVLPKELRWKYRINCGDMVEIYTDGDNILLRKYNQEENFMEQVEMLYETVEHMEKEMEITKELQDYLKQIRGKLEKIQEE